jgi:hypothetical protein
MSRREFRVKCGIIPFMQILDGTRKAPRCTTRALKSARRRHRRGGTEVSYAELAEYLNNIPKEAP